MIRLRGHFDGQTIVLDEPPPPDLQPATPVEVRILDVREKALRDMEAFLKELWARPLPSPSKTAERRWSREELYERGGSSLS